VDQQVIHIVSNLNMIIVRLELDFYWISDGFVLDGDWIGIGSLLVMDQH
jgi:hypothetical protein